MQKIMFFMQDWNILTLMLSKGKKTGKTKLYTDEAWNGLNRVYLYI